MAPVLAIRKVDLSTLNRNALRSDAVAHKVTNASCKSKETVVEELWQHYTKCHQKYLRSENMKTNGASKENEKSSAKSAKDQVAGEKKLPAATNARAEKTASVSSPASILKIECERCGEVFKLGEQVGGQVA